MPEYSKDVMIAIMGADAALAGLLLVVAGYVFAQANGFPRATTDDRIIQRYQIAGKLGLIPFLLALVDSGACLWWLLQASPRLFTGTVGGFILLMLTTGIYGSVLILRYL